MKVLIVAQLFPPDMGGGATRAYNMAKGLMLNGCKVTVITAFPHYPYGKIPEQYRWKLLKPESFDGMRVIRTFVPPLESRGFMKRLVLFVSFMLSSLLGTFFAGKFDIVWAANPNILSFFPCCLLGLVARKPVILNVDDLWPDDLLNIKLMKKGSAISGIAHFTAKLAYTKANLITPTSPGYINVLRRKYDVDPSKIRVVLAGVDLSKFKIGMKRQEKTFQVIYSGAFSPLYDFDQVLHAAETLRHVPDVEFVLQGGGELVGHLKAKAKELDLRNVEIVDRIISRAAVAQLLTKADALVLPLMDFGTPYLGISSKLFEYQAVGKPILCCALGAPADYVLETMSGLVIKPGDCEGLAKSILYLKENQNVAAKMGICGRQHVETNLSLDKIGLKMKNYLKSLTTTGQIQ